MNQKGLKHAYTSLRKGRTWSWFSSLDFSDRHTRRLALISSIIVCMLGLAAPWLWTYLSWNIGSALAVLVGILIVRVKEAGVLSHRYGGLALVFGGIHMVLGLQVALLMCIGACIWWAIEAHVGKVSYLPLMIWGLISPAISSWLSAFTFPLRLEMGLLTARNLQLLGMDVTAEGSHFMVNGQLYTVEEACVGVHTLLTGLILMTLIFAYFEKKQAISFSLPELSVGYTLAGLIALVANLIRIHLLVIFRSPPHTFSHELLGILTILWSIVLPLWLMTWIYTRFLRRRTSPLAPGTKPLWGIFTQARPWFQTLRMTQYVVLIGLGFYTLNYHYTEARVVQSESTPFVLEGWEHEKVFGRIAKYSQEDALVYLKPPVPPWRADHSPLICWKGSGFEFSHIRRTHIGGFEVLQAQIIKESSILYTCWWYDNGHTQTTRQWEWRKLTLGGAAPFHMLSVTATSMENLSQKVQEVQQAWNLHQGQH